MKQVGWFDRSPLLPKRLGTVLLMGLPIVTFALLVTQPEIRATLGRVSSQTFSPLNAPYRYPFADTLAGFGRPIASVEREIAFYQERIQRQPSSGLDRAYLASAYLQMARSTGEGSWYLLAEQTAQQSLAALPNHPDALLVLARVAEARHDFASAQALLVQVPDQPDALSAWATTHLATGNLAAAHQAAEAAVDRLPSLSSLTLLALVQAAQGSDDAALRSFQQAIGAEEPGEISSSARTRVLLGRFYYERGQLAQAEALYRESLRILPQNPLALLNLAQLQLRQGQYGAANRHYMAIAAASNGIPRSFDPLVLRGRARIQAAEGNRAAAEALWAEAEALLRQTLSEQSVAFGHERDLARLLLERGNPTDVPEALALMRSQIKTRQDAETLDTLAWALMASNRHMEAQQVIQQAIGLGTRDAALFDRAGAIAQKLGNQALADAYFRTVRAIDPQFDAAARRASGLGAGLGS